MDQERAATGPLDGPGGEGRANERPENPPSDQPERRPDPDEDQIGILPGDVPGKPLDPSDPRFPGSQPDTA